MLDMTILPDTPSCSTATIAATSSMSIGAGVAHTMATMPWARSILVVAAWGPTPPTPSIAVRWPLKYKEAKKMSYKELKSLLEELGFTNVKGKTEEIPSMNIRRFKSGQIKEISIYTVERTYQNNEIKEGQALPPNAKIEIIYFK